MLKHNLHGEVALADGSVVDLRPLSRERLLALQWEQEREFARRILARPPARRPGPRRLRRAYDAVTRIYAAAAGSSGEPLRMGLDPRYERLVLALLTASGAAGCRSASSRSATAAASCSQRVRDAGYPVAGIEVSDAMRDDACRLLGADAAEHLWRAACWTSPFRSRDAAPSLIYWNDVSGTRPARRGRGLSAADRGTAPAGRRPGDDHPQLAHPPLDVTSVFCPPRTEAAGVHLKEYTLRELTRLLRAAGFDRVATPWIVTPRRIVLCGNGMAGAERLMEPAPEWTALPPRPAPLPWPRALDHHCPQAGTANPPPLETPRRDTMGNTGDGKTPRRHSGKHHGGTEDTEEGEESVRV